MNRKYLILFSLSGFLITLDQLTKTLVYLNLAPGKEVPLLGSAVTLLRSSNTGFAFGLIERAPDSLQDAVFVGVPAFALILIVLIFIKLQDDQWPTSVALATIFSGAVGNLIDRIQYGYVVDFLRLGMFGKQLPTFNLADCFIGVGIGLMVLQSFRKGRVA